MSKRFRRGPVMSTKKRGKKFRCGRIILTKDNKIKKLSLEKGGGSRSCKYFGRNMNFDDVRGELVRVFNIDNPESILLYDYQLCPLNSERYGTVSNYMYNNGLNWNSIVIYLCTREIDDDDQSREVVMKKKKKHPTKSSNLSTINQQKSTSSIEDKYTVKTEPFSRSLLEYSFKNASNDLVENLRNLINENNFNEMLIHLFQYICTIHGYVLCASIDRLQQNQSFQSINQLEQLNNICQSIQTLLDLNKTNFDQIENFSTINNLFIEFYQNLKILRNRYKLDEPSFHSNNSSSTSLSITHQLQSEDNELIPSKKLKLEKLYDNNNRQMDIAVYSSLNV